MPEQAKRVNGLHLPLTLASGDIFDAGSRTREHGAGNRAREPVPVPAGCTRAHTAAATGGAACPARSA